MIHWGQLVFPKKIKACKGGSIKMGAMVSICLLSLILPVGCQEAVIPKPTPAPIPADARLVCLFFDDAYLNQYDVALPVLLKYDFKATFGVITGSIGRGHDLWEYMDKEKLRELASYGMDIAGHTKTHLNLTGNLTDEQMRQEIIESKKHLEAMGFEVTTMVYPYYAWDDRVIEYVMEAGYTCARAGWSKEQAYDLTTSDPKARYHAAAWQISHQDMARFQFIVNKASRQSVVSLVYHFISDTGPEATSTPVANFHAQMSYLKEAGFAVALFPDLFRQ
jgi:peptidoglycan/xylan/chitin deacetylase (PgdA/CDA1 family)